MYRITTDIEKNRLSLTLVGFITEQEALSIKKTLISEIANLAPYFDIINDISHFRFGLEKSGEVLIEIINYLSTQKVNKVIRVVGGAQAGIMQFASFTGENPDYKVFYSPTVEDAENILNNGGTFIKKVL